jgi:outer membrane immunogenic protein
MAISPAYAAEPIYKAQPPAIPYAWSGFYLGGNAGWSASRTSNLNPPNAGPQFELAPTGWVGGAQAGFNWQTGPWMLGAEADWQITTQQDSACLLTCGAVSATGILNLQQKLPWFATLRGRAGYAHGPWLWYITAGLAWADVEESAAFAQPGSATQTGGLRQVKTGWTAGAGVETALAGNWTAKFEYLFMDLGSIAGNLGVANPAAAFPFAPQFNSQFRDHIVRTGLNYHFGGSAYANAASAAPNHDWRGFYAGLNAGYGTSRNHSREDKNLAGIFAGGDQFTLADAGAIAGAQAGHNWQMGNVVVGLEADWQWSNEADTYCRFTSSCMQNDFHVTHELSSFATLRARLGYADGEALWYATAGVATGNFRSTAGEVIFAPGPTASFSHTNSGWTAGGGVETALVGNVTGRIEYVYLNLGNTTDVFALPPAAGISPVVTINSQIRDHIFRAGVNYRFGG